MKQAKSHCIRKLGNKFVRFSIRLSRRDQEHFDQNFMVLRKLLALSQDHIYTEKDLADSPGSSVETMIQGSLRKIQRLFEDGSTC